MTLTSPPVNVSPFDSGRLAAGISASATTITVSPIYKTVNGVRTKQGFNTTSGIALITQGDFTERISFEGSSVDATTKVTTLTTCVRGLSATSTTASFSGGTGRAWTKGAKITVVADASYFQSGVFKNVANAFTAANTFAATSTFNAPVIVAGTTSYVKLPELTTSERDALTAAEGMLIKNSTTGTIQQYTGGAWASVGTDATANGSTTVAGKYEEATVAEQGTATATGATGARLVPAVANLVKSSSGASDENKIPLLQADGALHINHIATGTPDGTKFVRDDGVLATPASVDVRAGDGTDGALNVTSGTTTIDLTGANLVEKNYTSINVSSGATLAFSNPAADGTIIILRSQGNVTLAGTVTGTNLGSTGAASGGVATNAAVQGIAGTNSYNSFGQTRYGGAGAASTNSGNVRASGGAGGASTSTSGSNSTASAPAGAATGGTALTIGAVAVGLTGVILSPGAGGGSGGAASSTTAGTTATATGGAGGRGAGALLIICGGNYTDAGGTINFAGTDGSTGTKVNGTTQFSCSAGGGGGGGGGSYCALVSGTITSSGTRTVTGGAAGSSVSDGAGGNNGDAGAAGAGGTGLALVIPII